MRERAPRVLLAAAAVPGVAGGIELWCARAAVALKARGFDTAILAAEYDPGTADRAAGILRANYGRYGVLDLLGDVPIAGLGVAGRPPSWASADRICRFFGSQLAALDADVVFPNEISLAWHCCAGAARSGLRVRPAVLVHTDRADVYETMERHRWLAADAAGVSSRIAQELERRFRQPADVIPYGVCTTAAAPAVARRSSGPLRLGFIGRIRESHKGVFMLADVLAAVRTRGADAECWIVGEGPDEAALRQRFDAAGVGACVRWFGAVPASEVPAVAASIDVLLMPSLFEGISIAMLEAMAQSVVPVVAPVSGTDDAIEDGRNGVLLKSRSVEEMADACVRLALDGPRLRAMGDAARATIIARYSEDLHWDRLARFIERRLAAPAPQWPRDRYPTGAVIGRTHRLIPEPLGTFVRRIASLSAL